MPLEFKVGDKVRRNSFFDEEYDGNDIPADAIGIIDEINEHGKQPYLVIWQDIGYDGEELAWWIIPDCIELYLELTGEALIAYRLKRVLEKIQYLDKRYTERDEQHDTKVSDRG